MSSSRPPGGAGRRKREEEEKAKQVEEQAQEADTDDWHDDTEVMAAELEDPPTAQLRAPSTRADGQLVMSIDQSFPFALSRQRKRKQV